MFYYTIPFLFLELAVLMNIAKWIYFILAVRAHRNIRIFEINMDIFAEREGLYTPTMSKVNTTADASKQNPMIKKQIYKDS